MMRPTRRGYRLAVNVLAAVAFIGIGGLQMYGVDAGPITSYGADLLAPPILYFAFREGYRFGRPATVWRLRPLGGLLVVFTGCAVWEWSQRYNLRGTPLAIAAGTFDWLDLGAYAFGLLVCYGLDVLWLRPRRITPG